MEFLHRCIIFPKFSLFPTNKAEIPAFSQEPHFAIDLGTLKLQFYSIIGHAAI